MMKEFKIVTSQALDPSPLSQTVTPFRTPYPFERDLLYERLFQFNDTVPYRR